MSKKSSGTETKLSPRQRRDLDIEIEFLSGLVKRDPDYVEALQILGDTYTQRGKYEKGLEIDERLAKLCPEDPLVQYNLACSYSLTEQPESAASCLDRALDLGYRDFHWLSRDPDLANLRKHPEYKQIRAKIRQLRIGTS